MKSLDAGAIDVILAISNELAELAGSFEVLANYLSEMDEDSDDE